MIFVSTNCLKNPSNVLRVLDEYDKAKIENVELGSVHAPFDIKKLKKFNFNFIIHNYFPPPKNAFNFNLASQKKQILKKSIKLAKNAIDLCAEIESPLYTFHAGFTSDPPKLGKSFPKKNFVDHNTAIITFFDSVEKIILYAKSRGKARGLDSTPKWTAVHRCTRCGPGLPGCGLQRVAREKEV